MSSDKHSQFSGDHEKNGGAIHDGDEHAPRTTVVHLADLDDGVPRNKGIFASLWKFARHFDAIGAEARGIERVRPEDRPVVSLLFHYFPVEQTRTLLRARSFSQMTRQS